MPGENRAIADMDALANVLLSASAFDSVRFAYDMNAAIAQARLLQVSIVPREVLADKCDGTLQMMLVGERKFPNLVARSYRIEGPTAHPCAYVFSINEAGDVTNVNVRFLPDGNPEAWMRYASWILWDISTSLTLKLSAFGMLPTISVTGTEHTTEFQVLAGRWTDLSLTQRVETIRRARAFALERQLICLNYSRPFTLVIRAVDESESVSQVVYRAQVRN